MGEIVVSNYINNRILMFIVNCHKHDKKLYFSFIDDFCFSIISFNSIKFHSELVKRSCLKDALFFYASTTNFSSSIRLN